MLPELIALLNVIVALIPEVQTAIPVIDKLVSGTALNAADIATLVATREALEAKAFPPAPPAPAP